MLSTCSGVKSKNRNFNLSFDGTFACHTGCTRPPAEQSEAGKGSGCTPLLTSKYDSNIVKKDGDIEVGNHMAKHAFWGFRGFPDPHSPRQFGCIDVYQI